MVALGFGPDRGYDATVGGSYQIGGEMAATIDSLTRGAPVAIPDGEIDGFEAAAYDPGLYAAHRVVVPIDGHAALGSDIDDHVETYESDGYLAIAGFFDRAEVAAALAGMVRLIDGKAPGFRGLQFEAGARKLLATAAPEAKQDYVRKLTGFTQFDADLHAIATHPRLLAIVRRLIRAEPAIFEDKALIKPPRLGREKPWHQDHAYWNLPLDARVVTVWIALDAATEANGCLYLIPGSHREGAVVHFKRRDWQICDTEVDRNRVVVAPLDPGGVLLFNSYLLHGTPANASPMRRRALQFVYVPAEAARITPAERLAVFGSEGKDVTC